MKISFDGIRKNTTANINELCEVLKEALDEINDDDLKERLRVAFNNTAQSIDFINCIQDDDVEDDINDLSEILSVQKLEEQDLRMTNENIRANT